MSLTTFRVPAPAKVNLSLEVLGTTDDGFHELDTVFCWLELADELVLTPAPSYRLLLEGEFAGDLPCGEDNLVTRALRSLERECQRNLAVEVRVLKRLPAGGGVGGGSADAAAALWGVNQLFELGLAPERLAALAADLGADVAFGLVGGAARGRGKGDVLEPLTPPPALPVLLLDPGFPCPTPRIYAAWDRECPRPARGASQAMAEALARGDLEALFANLANDLAPAAEALFPELLELRDALLTAGCRQALLSGSGSCLFGLFAPGEDPKPAAEKLRDRGARVMQTRLMPLRRWEV